MSNPPTTTLMPFGSLPPCALQCGDLYDANGACVPPAAPVSDEATYENCFCQYAPLQPWRQGPTGVCPGAKCDAAGYSSIQSWFTSLCNIGNAGEQSLTTSSLGSSPTSGSQGGSNKGGGGGDWLSTHWKWVIMIVILVVGIAGIWIGACIWRRRYLKRKDRAFELGKHSGSAPAHGSWGPGAGSAAHMPNPPSHSAPGVFMPGNTTSGMYDEKPKKTKEKKTWVVKERT